MQEDPDLYKLPSRGTRTSLTGFLGLVTSGVWLLLAAGCFLGFIFLYFYTLELESRPNSSAYGDQERMATRVDYKPPPTGVLLSNLDARGGVSFMANIEGHFSKHCAVRISPIEAPSAFAIFFVRKAEVLRMSLPRENYQGMVACGEKWDDEDYSFEGVQPIMDPPPFFSIAPEGSETGVSLYYFWDKHGE